MSLKHAEDYELKRKIRKLTEQQFRIWAEESSVYIKNLKLCPSEYNLIMEYDIIMI